MKARTCGCHSHNGLVLSPEGLAQRTLSLDEVDGMDASRYLDKVGSVSGLELERDLYAIQSSQQLLEQSERFHSGS